MSEHIDTLDDLNKHIPLKEKLVRIHQVIKQSLPYVARIAISLYDPKTRILKTFIHSSDNNNPLPHYQAPIEEAPSLKAILDKKQPRIINNMLTFDDGSHEHMQRLGRSGYAASYTMPIFNDGDFLGFLFFNSTQTDVFDSKTLAQIDVFGHLISLMLIKELSTIRTLAAALKTASKITHLRDPETGSHLDRMSRYSRLIATALADKYSLEDDYIEHVFMFSPLHDIGKIGIPDEVLMKKGRLTEEERKLMRTHAMKGREIIDEILKEFGLEGFDYVEILRNITEFHHESVDGSGYPAGRRGSDIPLEARIVAVADVFDALTSKRCYKEAWTNEEAFAQLQKMAGETLDADCVQALLDNRDEVENIQRYFCENAYG
ncbi:MAG TPA: HD domain-containing protein [Gammaproteobacteria bacterium]|nr:HD domain-containing protein [Gammaproteobacteria bacterium]